MIMKEIVEKIGSYNLFNYLLPGTIYVSILKRVTSIDFIDDNLFVTGFLCYFIGMIISRIGSLLIEPALKKMEFLKFKDYGDFVQASKTDGKINILSEQNNTYRSITAMILSTMITVPYDMVRNKFESIQVWDVWVIMTGILVLFLFSYRKQTSYISKRIEKNLEN